MKRSVKWLALLLAGLLLTASLAACTAKQGDAGEDTQDQQNDQNDQNADKLLTPAALRQAIINGEEMSIFVESGWAGDENEYVYIRDGDKAKRSIGEDVRYYDFAEAKRYGYFPEEDRWEVFELTQPDWASFVNELIWTDDGADPLLMDENYTLKDGRYVLTEAGAMAELEYVRQGMDEFDRIYGENPAIEAYSEYTDGKYIFYSKLEGEDGRFCREITITVIFREVTVVLPEVYD